MIDSARAETLVRVAMSEASAAATAGDPPFGAVLANADGVVLATARNRQISRVDPTAHAEIELLRQMARRTGSLRFAGTWLISNAEPCSMCLSACIKSDILQVQYGAAHEPQLDPDLPATTVAASSLRPMVLVGGILAAECAAQIALARRSGRRAGS